MLGVGERVDRADAAEAREFFDVVLRERADDGAVDHAAHDARGVSDGLAAAELDVVGCEKNRLSAQLADADLEAQARASGGFREHDRPAFAGERGVGMGAAEAFHGRRAFEEFVDPGRVERLDVEQVPHCGSLGQRFCQRERLAQDAGRLVAFGRADVERWEEA